MMFPSESPEAEDVGSGAQQGYPTAEWALPKQALDLSANFLHGASCSQEAQSLSSCAWTCSFKKIFTLFHAAF